MYKMKKVRFAKGMKLIALVSILVTAVLGLVYWIWPNDVLQSGIITCGTIAYHFFMRLLVGELYNLSLKNNVNYNQKWFRVGAFEQRLYQLLKVKKWKKFLPTYDPDAFDRRQHSWHEIAGAMCQSELIHETIAVLSFLPIVFSIWFDSVLVFVLTSIFAALFDLSFVAIQRFNRTRVLKRLIDRMEVK